MIRKSLQPKNGIKVTTQFSQRKSTPHKHHQKIDNDDRINICLNCTKPASECKGKCFGGV